MAQVGVGIQKPTYCWKLLGVCPSLCSPIMENQMESKMENDMEATRVYCKALGYPLG